MTPTLTLMVQREAEIDGFKPMSFYNVVIDCNDIAASSERMTAIDKATSVKEYCEDTKNDVVQSVETKDKREKEPAL